MVRAHARHRTAAFCADEKIAGRSDRSNKGGHYTLLPVADQRPQRCGHFERKTRAWRTVARGKRPNASLRAPAEVLSRLAEAESRRRLVPRESPCVNFARTVRLDHEPRGF